MQVTQYNAQRPVRDATESSPCLQHPASKDKAYEVRDSVVAELLGRCGHHSTILLFLSIFGIVIGVSTSLVVHPTYRATTLIEIQRINENYLNLKENIPVSQAPAEITLDDVQNKLKLLQTPGLIARVMSNLGMLREKPQDAPFSKLTALLVPFRRSDHPPDPVQDAVERMAKRLEVKAVGRTNLIEVSFESDNSTEAAAFANAIVKEFNEQDIESRASMNEHTRDWTNIQIEDLRQTLTRSEHALERYAKKAGLIFFAEPTGVHAGKTQPGTTPDTVSIQRLRQVQDDLSKAKANRFAKEAAYQIAKQSTPQSVPDIVADSSIRDVQSKLADLNRERAALLASEYTPEYNKLKRANAQIQSLEQSLSTQQGILLQRMRNDYVQAIGQEQLLMKDYVDQAQIVNEDAAKSVQYDVLKRDVESARQIYDDMLQRLKETNLVSALRAGNIRTVDTAMIPNAPYKPNILLNAALGMVGGLFIGVLWIGYRERGSGIRNPGELKSYFSTVELGAIRSAKRRFYSRVRLQFGFRQLTTPEFVVAPKENSTFMRLQPRAGGPLELITFQSEPSVIAKSFRSVLTSIRFCSVAESASQVYVVTSPSAGEGKTTVATNLAIMLAETYKHVLLVDGDLYKPRLNDVFTVPNVVGLSELLQVEESGGSTTLASAVQQTEVDGLSLLTSGQWSHHKGQLLFSAHLSRLIKQMREGYDVVVVDTPPLLEFADARVLARLADSVILVIRSRKTTRAGVAAALDRLNEDGARLLGSVLNDWDPEKTASTYYVDK